MKFMSLPYEDEMVKNDTVLKEKRDRWHESLSKDVYVDGALHILNDMQNGSDRKGLTDKVKTEKLVKS